MANDKRPSEEEMWAGPSGERWRANAMRFEETLRPIGEAVIARAAIAAGERVIDVGCGAGGMSLEIAEKVGMTGSVLGLDISAALVAEGTRRAEAAGLSGRVNFVVGDAAKVTLAEKADVLVSRFGVMFFTDPYGAFGHMHGLVRKGGRLAMATWAPLSQNPWMGELREVLARHFEMPVVPPRTPGPFAFDEPAYFGEILEKAGFGELEFEHVEVELFVGGKGTGAEAATEFLLNAFSFAQRAVEAPEEIRGKVRAEVVEKLRAFETTEGVRMKGAVWLVTGRA